MITHVIVKLDAPIEEKYWQDDDIFSNEYYGLGKPLIRCKDCIHRYSTCPMITIHPTGSISFRTQDDWFCFMGKRKEE